jgi:hypothetical protein
MTTTRPAAHILERYGWNGWIRRVVDLAAAGAALPPAARSALPAGGHPHIGFLLVHSTERGPVVLGPRGARYLADHVVEGEDPLAPFPASAADHLRRTDGFEHVADIMVNSFYDPDLEQGCAFEELISFHGGLGGPQTQPFILHPVELSMPPEPIRGAAAVHEVLMEWRRALQGAPELTGAGATSG